MKKNLKKTLLVLVIALMTLATFNACDMGLPWDIELWGTWTAYTNTITITNDTYSIDDSSSWDWDYSGEIVKYDNFSYNIAADNPAEGDYGYFIFHITEHKGDSSQEGTYTVVRWRALTTEDGVTTVETSEAYPAGWATAEEAEAQAEDDHFAMWSSMTKSAE